MTTRTGFAQRLALWRKLFELLRQCNPRLGLAVAALAVLEAGAGMAVLYLVKQLVDYLTAELSQAGQLVETGQVFVYMTLIGLTMVLTVAVQRLGEYARHRQGAEVADYVDREIHARAISVDLGFYESPLYHDSLERARAAGNQRPAEVVGSLAQFLRSIAYLVGVLVLMAAIDFWLVPLLLVSICIALVVRLYFTRQLYAWQRHRTQLERRAGYLDWLITSVEHAKELRMGHLGGALRDRYSGLRRKIRSEELVIEKSKALAEVGAAIAAALVFFGTTAWLVFQVIDGGVGIGDLVLFLLLFRRAELSGREFISALAALYGHQLYLGQLFDFFDVKPSLTAPADCTTIPRPVREGIRFHNVGFRYPANDAPALEDIDFELRAGKITAIVGENGSGKTSLIKLLCRLYDPDQGHITLDGTDIRQFDPVAYRQLFSVMFQDYACYAETVAENIRYGAIEAPPDIPRIGHAADMGGASRFIADLPRGLDTPLTRLFDDGRELSLGQWQRVALSRAFFPHAQFIIMDEPTSAVDPRAEAELFDNFRERLNGRGALIISHRLSTIRMADRIYVLENGRFLEAGSHEELVAHRGQYAALFARQARAFGVANQMTK